MPLFVSESIHSDPAQVEFDRDAFMPSSFVRSSSRVFSVSVDILVISFSFVKKRKAQYKSRLFVVKRD